jgi:cell division protein FtsQ
MSVDKESRIELLRRQRLLQGEKKVKHITHNASMQLNDDNPQKSKFFWSLFKKKEPVKSSIDRVYPLSANEPQQKKQENKVNRIRISWRIFSFILVIIFSAFVLIAWQSPDYQVGIVEIKGLERISQDEVSNSFEILQHPIITIQPEEIIQKIDNAFPEIKEIKIAVSIPNKVTVSLAERKPVIAWKVNETTLWVDSDGIVFPARGHAGELLTVESFSLPVFSFPKEKGETEILMNKFLPKHSFWKLPPYSMIWFEYHRIIDPGLLTAILRLNTQIPSEKVLLYDSHRGLGWNDPRGWKIFFGFNLEQINEKWLTLEKIINELTNQGIKPTLVSVEYLHAPYFRTD